MYLMLLIVTAVNAGELFSILQTFFSYDSVKNI